MQQFASALAPHLQSAMGVGQTQQAQSPVETTFQQDSDARSARITGLGNQFRAQQAANLAGKPLQNPAFENGGNVKETPEQLMARMSAKYGAPAAAPAAAPVAQPIQQPIQQVAPAPKGIVGLLRGRSAQIDKAAGYEHGGEPSVDHRGFIHGPKGVDKVPAKVAETGEDILVSHGERIVNKEQNKALEALAESSRKIAIMSVEQYRFVIQNALKLRADAMAAAGDYIKALASAPEMTSRMVNIGYDAQQKMITAAAAFYNADTQAKEAVSKVKQFNSGLALQAAEKNQMADLTLIEDKLKALLAEAQAIASMAAAMFNNLHVSAGMNVNGGVNGSVVSS